MANAALPKDARRANRRGAARLAAVQALYQMDLASTSLNEIMAEFESHWLGREVEGDEYRGIVKVKVGPITAQYRGTAKIVDIDATAHRAVLRAEGRETRGQGGASATVTATLEQRDSATGVHQLL